MHAKQDRPAQIRDVEERELRAEYAPLVGCVLADPEQQVATERMQVGGVAADLQLAEDGGPGRLREVERIERVDPPERDDVARVAGEPDGVDPFPFAEPADPAELDECTALLAEGRHEALALLLRAWIPPRRLLGARDAKHTLVLGERPLVHQVARHGAAAPVLGRARMEMSNLWIAVVTLGGSDVVLTGCANQRWVAT